MKVRVRKCKSGGKCIGPSRERVVCRIPCGNSPQITPPPVIERKSLGGLIRGIESQDKITRQLSVWGSWSECSKSCGVGIRKRRRKFCKTSMCSLEKNFSRSFFFNFRLFRLFELFSGCLSDFISSRGRSRAACSTEGC